MAATSGRATSAASPVPRGAAGDRSSPRDTTEAPCSTRAADCRRASSVPLASAFLRAAFVYLACDSGGRGTTRARHPWRGPRHASVRTQRPWPSAGTGDAAPPRSCETTRAVPRVAWLRDPTARRGTPARTAARAPRESRSPPSAPHSLPSAGGQCAPVPACSEGRASARASGRAHVASTVARSTRGGRPGSRREVPVAVRRAALDLPASCVSENSATPLKR